MTYVMQEALQHLLTDEEKRRNSRRLDQVYMLSSHPTAPDVFELADSSNGLDESARTALSKPLDANITGELAWPLLHPRWPAYKFGYVGMYAAGVSFFGPGHLHGCPADLFALRQDSQHVLAPVMRGLSC